MVMDEVLNDSKEVNGVFDEKGGVNDEYLIPDVVIEQEKRCKCDDAARAYCDHQLFDCVYCPCNNYDEDKQNIQCPSCFVWYCCGCVGLTGLKEDEINRMVDWACYPCWAMSSPIAAKCGSVSPSVSKNNTDVESLGAAIATSMRSHIKQSIEEAISALPEPKVFNTEEEKEKIKKTWAEVVGQEQKDLIDELKKARDEVKKAKSSGPSKETVAQVVRETAELTIKTGLTKIDKDHIERQKRVCNIVIKRVEEKEDINEGTRYDKNFVIEKLNIPAGEIVNVFRAGPLEDKEGKRRTSRPIIVELVDKSSADYWHNNGKGRKVEGTQLYINQDLCVADRHANFLAREEYRKRQNAKNISPTS